MMRRPPGISALVHVAIFASLFTRSFCQRHVYEHTATAVSGPPAQRQLGHRKFIRKEFTGVSEKLDTAAPEFAIPDAIRDDGLIDVSSSFNASNEKQGYMSLGQLKSQHQIGFVCDKVVVELPHDLLQEQREQRLRHAHGLASLCGDAEIEQRKLPPGKHSLFESTERLQGGAWRQHGVLAKGGVVIVERWNGQLGNRLVALASALVFAVHVGADELKIDGFDGGFGYSQLFAFNPRTPIKGNKRFYDLVYTEDYQAMQDSCHQVADQWNRQNQKAYNWWGIHCARPPVRLYRDLLKAYLQPYYTPALSSCVKRPLTSEEKRTLTVHYRSGDDVRVSEPCAVADKIFQEGSFVQLRVVTVAGSGENDMHRHPCVSYHVKKGAEVQSGTLLEDTCAILRAKDLLVSWSSYPQTLSFLSDNLEHLYSSMPPNREWIPFATGCMDLCTDEKSYLWPRTQLSQYGFPEDWDAEILRVKQTSGKQFPTSTDHKPTEKEGRERYDAEQALLRDVKRRVATKFEVSKIQKLENKVCAAGMPGQAANDPWRSTAWRG